MDQMRAALQFYLLTLVYSVSSFASAEAGDGSTNFPQMVPVSSAGLNPLPPIVSVDPKDNRKPVWQWVSGGKGTGTFRYSLNSNEFGSNSAETKQTQFRPEVELAPGKHTLYVQEKDIKGGWTESGFSEVQIQSDGWRIEALLKASNVSVDARFGSSVALHGKQAAVGAWKESSGYNTITNGPVWATDQSLPQSGAVYLFARREDKWQQEAFIKASNAGELEWFGRSVAISGDTVAVGAWGEDSNQATITNGQGSSFDDSAPKSGAVYIYKKDENGWQQEAFVKAPNPKARDYFGKSVAVSEGRVVIGVVGDDSEQTTISETPNLSLSKATDSGAVYIIGKSEGKWQHQAFVKAANAQQSDSFGSSVALSGDTVVVGAYFEDSNQTTITNGSTASTNDGLTSSGAAYIYRMNEESWVQEAYLKPSHGSIMALFGSVVDISGDTAVVSAFYEDSNHIAIMNGDDPYSDEINNSGAVYIFRRDGKQWVQEAHLKANNAGPGDHYGYSVSVSGNTVAVGARSEDSNLATVLNGQEQFKSFLENDGMQDSGAVYVYRRSGGKWVHEALVKAVNSGEGDFFGSSLALSGDTLIIGSPREDSGQTVITNGRDELNSHDDNNNRQDSGAVYVYRNTGRMFAPANISLSSDGSSLILNWVKNLGYGVGVRVVYQAGDISPSDCSSDQILYEGEKENVSLELEPGTYSFRFCTTDVRGLLSSGTTFSGYIH